MPIAIPTVLLIGASGLLGRAVHQHLLTCGQVHAASRSKLDLLQPAQVRQVLQALRPQVVINCAAYSAVDAAQMHPQAAQALNHDAVAHLVTACDAVDASLIHFSTDYVFDGQQAPPQRPYVETDAPHPLSVYGQTKLDGERAVLRSPGAHWVLRVSWLYGPGGRNFFSQIDQLLAQDGDLPVVDDQISVPNDVGDIAQALLRLLSLIRVGGPSFAARYRGLWHFSGAQATSRYQFAQQRAKRLSSLARARLLPLSSTEYAAQYAKHYAARHPDKAAATLAPRPAYSVLGSELLMRELGIAVGVAGCAVQ